VCGESELLVTFILFETDPGGVRNRHRVLCHPIRLPIDAQKVARVNLFVRNNPRLVDQTDGIHGSCMRRSVQHTMECLTRYIHR
jgi:hypothetical protein